MQSMGLSERHRLGDAQLGMQRLQDRLAPGEEGIARQGHTPVWGERGQAGFQEVAGLLVIQAQMLRQFEDKRLTAGQEVSLFPSDDGTAMHPYGVSKLLLGQVPADAQGFEQLAKRSKIVVSSWHLLAFLENSFCCPQLLRSLR